MKTPLPTTLISLLPLSLALPSAYPSQASYSFSPPSQSDASVVVKQTQSTPSIPPHPEFTAVGLDFSNKTISSALNAGISAGQKLAGKNCTAKAEAPMTAVSAAINLNTQTTLVSSAATSSSQTVLVSSMTTNPLPAPPSAVSMSAAFASSAAGSSTMGSPPSVSSAVALTTQTILASSMSSNTLPASSSSISTPAASATSATASGSTASSTAPRADGRCGSGFGGATCQAGGKYGGCCSKYGYCGVTTDHCGAGCQSRCTSGGGNSTSSNTTLASSAAASSSSGSASSSAASAPAMSSSTLAPAASSSPGAAASLPAYPSTVSMSVSISVSVTPSAASSAVSSSAAYSSAAFSLTAYPSSLESSSALPSGSSSSSSFASASNSPAYPSSAAPASEGGEAVGRRSPQVDGTSTQILPDSNYTVTPQDLEGSDPAVAQAYALGVATGRFVSGCTPRLPGCTPRLPGLNNTLMPGSGNSGNHKRRIEDILGDKRSSISDLDLLVGGPTLDIETPSTAAGLEMPKRSCRVQYYENEQGRVMKETICQGGNKYPDEDSSDDHQKLRKRSFISQISDLAKRKKDCYWKYYMVGEDVYKQEYCRKTQRSIGGSNGGLFGTKPSSDSDQGGTTKNDRILPRHCGWRGHLCSAASSVHPPTSLKWVYLLSFSLFLTSTLCFPSAISDNQVERILPRHAHNPGCTPTAEHKCSAASSIHPPASLRWMYLLSLGLFITSTSCFSSTTSDHKDLDGCSLSSDTRSKAPKQRVKSLQYAQRLLGYIQCGTYTEVYVGNRNTRTINNQTTIKEQTPQKPIPNNSDKALEVQSNIITNKDSDSAKSVPRQQSSLSWVYLFIITLCLVPALCDPIITAAESTDTMISAWKPHHTGAAVHDWHHHNGTLHNSTHHEHKLHHYNGTEQEEPVAYVTIEEPSTTDTPITKRHHNPPQQPHHPVNCPVGKCSEHGPGDDEHNTSPTEKSKRSENSDIATTPETLEPRSPTPSRSHHNFDYYADHLPTSEEYHDKTKFKRYDRGSIDGNMAPAPNPKSGARKSTRLNPIFLFFLLALGVLVSQASAAPLLRGKGLVKRDGGTAPAVMAIGTIVALVCLILVAWAGKYYASKTRK